MIDDIRFHWASSLDPQPMWYVYKSLILLYSVLFPIGYTFIWDFYFSKYIDFVQALQTFFIKNNLKKITRG